MYLFFMYIFISRFRTKKCLIVSFSHQNIHVYILIVGTFYYHLFAPKDITFSHQNMSNIEKTDFGAKMLDFEWCENVILMAEIWCENDIILV